MERDKGVTKSFDCLDVTEQKGQREETDRSGRVGIFAKDRNHETVPSREA